MALGTDILYKQKYVTKEKTIFDHVFSKAQLSHQFEVDW